MEASVPGDHCARGNKADRGKSVECKSNRRAQIDQDCLIEASAVFGGIDIYVPTNVNVKVSSDSVFGGVSNKAPYFRDANAPTIYIKGSCMFGGVDIK